MPYEAGEARVPTRNASRLEKATCSTSCRGILLRPRNVRIRTSSVEKVAPQTTARKIRTAQRPPTTTDSGRGIGTRMASAPNATNSATRLRDRQMSSGLRDSGTDPHDGMVERHRRRPRQSKAPASVAHHAKRCGTLPGRSRSSFGSWSGPGVQEPRGRPNRLTATGSTSVQRSSPRQPST